MIDRVQIMLAWLQLFKDHHWPVVRGICRIWLGCRKLKFLKTHFFLEIYSQKYSRHEPKISYLESINHSFPENKSSAGPNLAERPTGSGVLPPPVHYDTGTPSPTSTAPSVTEEVSKLVCLLGFVCLSVCLWTGVLNNSTVFCLCICLCICVFVYRPSCISNPLLLHRCR